MMMKLYNFELFPKHTLHLALFRNVVNGKEIMDKLMRGELSMALINPTAIMDELQILAAANAAIHAMASGKLVTKSIYSEMVFNLSPTRNISESLKKFGLQQDAESIIVGLFDAFDDNKLNEVRQLIRGTEHPIETVKLLYNEDHLRKLYNITLQEVPSRDADALLHAVINAISVKAIV